MGMCTYVCGGACAYVLEVCVYMCIYIGVWGCVQRCVHVHIVQECMCISVREHVYPDVEDTIP